MRRLLLAVLLISGVGLEHVGVWGSERPPIENGGSPATTRQAQPSGFLLGRVIDAISGQPVIEARVTLRREGAQTYRGGGAAQPPDAAPATQQVVLTTSTGHFLFREVAAGRYSLLVRTSGYVDGGYLQLDPADTRIRLIEVADGERRGDIDLRVWMLASIRGAVLDERGGPAAGATVRVLRRWSSAGREQLNLAGLVQADDRGRYAVNNLVPGEYVVGVLTPRATVPLSLVQRYAVAASADPSRPPEMLGQLRNAGVMSGDGTGFRIGDLILRSPGQRFTYGMPQSSDGRILSYASVYYQDSPRLLASTPIILGPGEERSSVDFALRLVSGVRVAGVVTEPNGLVEDIALRLVAEEPDGLISDVGYETATAVSSRGGRFTFLGVPPGTYVLKGSRSLVVRTGTQNDPTSNQIVWARQPISVGNDDISGLAVDFKPGLRVKGRAEFLSAQAAPSAEVLAQSVVGLATVASGITSRESSVFFRRDGTFETNGVPPGRYYVTTTAPKGWTLRSIINAGKNVADDPIELGAMDANVLVSFTDKIARISGTISEVGGTKDFGYSVLTFPADYDGWRRGDFNPRRIRLLSATASGAFAIENIPSGQYYIVALSDGSIPSHWSTLPFLEKLVASASKISVAEGENKIASLRPIVLRSLGR